MRRWSPRPEQCQRDTAYLRLLGIHQHEDDAARFLAVVEPGMIGGLLHGDVSGFQVHGFVVEHHVDLSRHDDRIVKLASMDPMRCSSGLVGGTPRAGADGPTTFIMK